MVPGPESMGAPTSLTQRRPNASNLPQFELPPPHLSVLNQKYPSYGTTQPPPATNLTSVGNLLTPPSNGSTDGISPSAGVTTGPSLPGVSQPFSPSSNGGMFPPPTTSSAGSYGYHSGLTPSSFGSGRPIFSPSLNSLVRGNSSPTAGEGLPPPPYELPHYQTTMSMSAPPLQTLPAQSHMVGNGMMGGQTPVSASVTQPSPVSAHEAFSRPPPTPTYYSGSQSASTPQQPTFPYQTGPSPVQQSPMSAPGPMPKMSPVNGANPSQPPSTYHRPYSYPMAGPVLSNVSNPGGQLALVGAMPHGMIPGFNSGHAAQMHQLYNHQHPQSNAQNDRPFRCDQCPQSFNRNHDLKRHKRIHLAVKPFPCGHCEKSFSRKDALKRHVLVKGCGKADAPGGGKESNGSVSPELKSESASTSPMVTASA
ncbi:hypothetical protein BAUCODRAFT_25915 [Baudoinia panamericana UAMH 10762]|uniref:C2H2-type domain-containing protein n=1 Tax=Baudoinia panamericana (strain UAMH 10762) TaxID=717646 RepID=M2LKJ8_BAUPA|nr:uncharacterized protein BAUCODRAFT_25915 [Baudoinia panamericana UAMH 10762]EMC94802.1 hypothetical protein BAUCODRAFT_25915 [Baudoinia panamericana UAMH 10762]